MDKCMFCGQSFPIDQMWVHVGNCKDAKVKCIICEGSFTRTDLQFHDCHMRQCSLCNAKMLRENLASHQGDCPQVLVKCSCGKTLYRKDFADHQAVCPQVLVNCSRCGENLHRKDFDSHQAVSPRSASIASAASSFTGRISLPTWQNQLRTSQRLPRMSKGRSAAWKL